MFRIGEVVKLMGVTRKTLLVFEEMGLLTPAVKDEKSGYRYYSADNITQIRSIRSLQALGLTLKEVADYYYNTENIDVYLNRLVELRASLDRNIQMLQVRSTKRGDLTVHRTTLYKQVCFCRKCECTDTLDVADKLRETYIAAVRTGKIFMLSHMFSVRIAQAAEKFNFMFCIPIESSYEGPERIEFDETPALCIFFRGPYEEINTAVKTLMEYVKQNNIEITGPFRSIYLEGPPNRGNRSMDYITQIAVPIKV